MMKTGGDRAQGQEEPALPARSAMQEAEGRTEVVGAHEVEEPVTGRTSPSWKCAKDEDLGELVGQDDDSGDEQPLGETGRGGGAGGHGLGAGRGVIRLGRKCTWGARQGL
jgi:hypothetical protein